jgi:hypothetical protein
MVCAPAWNCHKEEACFNIAKTIIDAWERDEHTAALTRAEAAAEVSSQARFDSVPAHNRSANWRA